MNVGTHRNRYYSRCGHCIVIYETADIRTGEAIRTRQTSPKSNYRETSYIGVFTSCIVDANWYRLIFTFGGYLRWYRVVNVRVLMSDSLHVLDYHAFRAVYRPHRAHCWKENRVCPLTINQEYVNNVKESHFCFRIISDFHVYEWYFWKNYIHMNVRII